MRASCFLLYNVFFVRIMEIRLTQIEIDLRSGYVRMAKHFGNQFYRHSSPQSECCAGSPETMRVHIVYSGTLAKSSYNRFNAF
jgi:hypothetical protein